jgi:subtilisin family serine protease
MPDVISVGGVYVTKSGDGDLRMEASNYASSYDSPIYPGRHVPDVCGLVGQQPAGVYIMLPVPPGSVMDRNLADANYPEGDGTAADDGWAVLSGTSAAAPQVAGVCALLNEVQPGISPDLAKSILMASARDVTRGTSCETELTPEGQPAKSGHDGATGAGLVDADMAHQLARSHTPRSVDTIPPPR